MKQVTQSSSRDRPLCVARARASFPSIGVLTKGDTLAPTHVRQAQDPLSAAPSHARSNHAGMRAKIYTVDAPGPGRISTMAMPRGGDWISDEMAALRAEGVDILVSMLTAREATELVLTSEAEAAEESGILFVNLPVPDRGVPEQAGFRRCVEDLAGRLRDGAHVAIHCRMGIGRASLLAAALLVAEGSDVDAAWAAVSRARGLEVPDTPEQREWLSRWVAGR